MLCKGQSHPLDLISTLGKILMYHFVSLFVSNHVQSYISHFVAFWVRQYHYWGHRATIPSMRCHLAQLKSHLKSCETYGKQPSTWITICRFKWFSFGQTTTISTIFLGPTPYCNLNHHHHGHFSHRGQTRVNCLQTHSSHFQDSSSISCFNPPTISSRFATLLD